MTSTASAPADVEALFGDLEPRRALVMVAHPDDSELLRGGSVATSRTHIRPTYRNFFPPEATWQFTGLRLARTPT